MPHLPAVHIWQRARECLSVPPRHWHGLKQSQGPPSPQSSPVFFLVMSGENMFLWRWLSLPCAADVLALGFWGRTELPRARADV